MNKLWYIPLIGIIAIGCSNSGPSGPSGINGYSVVSATVLSTTCPNGGVVLLTALDTNNNGVLDSSDTNIQSQVICAQDLAANPNTETDVDGSPVPKIDNDHYKDICKRNNNKLKECNEKGN